MCQKQLNFIYINIKYGCKCRQRFELAWNKKERKLRMKKGNGVAIIAALIGVIGTISGSVIGVIWGKNNVNVIVQIDGKNIVLQDSDVQEMASENEELKRKISDYEAEITDLKGQSEELATKLGNANGELEGIPSIEFVELGLSINGEEKLINREKASVYINGVQYYSQDFVNSLLPDNMSASVKDGTLYIGKIVKEKTNLFDRPVIHQSGSTYFYDSIKDTYGNAYGSALVFEYSDRFVSFNAGRNYSHFKCTVAMQERYNGQGELQIMTDDNIIYTSPEIINMTEPFDIDIPINQASTISIGTIGDSTSRIFISNAVLYNQE